MSLKSLKFTKASVETPMGEIVLRGLTLPMVRELIQAHPVETQAIYLTGLELSKQFETKPTEEVDTVAFVGTVIHNAPTFVAHVIALASGDADDDAIEIAKSLPIDVQLACLEKIAAVTFVMEGGARNFIGSVLRLAKAASAAIPK